MEQWADADADYNDILRMIEHARTQLDTRHAAPEPDDLDIASAQADLAFHTRRLPEQPPSLQFHQAFAEAQAARTAAAGGHKIVTEHDIVTARGDAERADQAARAALHDRRQALRRELDRADRDLAAAFAAAQTATSDTLETLLDSARSEVDLIRAAGHTDFDRTPLHIPDTALAAHDPAVGHRLKALAAQPYPLGYTRADVTDPDTATALYTLRATANANDRKVLWLSTTDESANTARMADLADTFTTIAQAHRRISYQQWTLPPGAIVIIDNPADTDPARLAGIAHHTASAGARAIIFDPTGYHGPSTPALRLLNALPWASTLTANNQAAENFRLDEPTPAVTRADRLGRTRLSDPWRQLLTDYDTAARAVRAAHRRHLTLTWRTPTAGIDEPDQTLSAGELGFGD
jgi:hypothetical protein